MFLKSTPLTLAAALCLSLSLGAQAAPSDPNSDPIGRLLLERKLIDRLSDQLGQARNNVSDSASTLVSSAMGLLGVPYRYGGNSPETGLDCSGLVRLVFEQSVGKVLPRRAADQAAATETIARSELKPGDLVFFNTMRRAFSHVGIYVGDGKFVHAPRSGARVRVEDMRKNYWQTRFNGARRVALTSEQAALARQ